MKNIIRFLILQLVLLIAVSQPVKNQNDINDTSANVDQDRADGYQKSSTPSCSINQYFDKEEARCLSIIGGGKVISINSTKSCGINVLKPYCNDPRYYYICKKNKTILMQCMEGQQFENRLQKCVYVNLNSSISSTDSDPDNKDLDSGIIHLPACERPGSFPIQYDCTLFYICEMNGHRIFQHVFKCPKGMVYDAVAEICRPSAVCKQMVSNTSLSLCARVATKETGLLQNQIKEDRLEESSSTEASSIDTTTGVYSTVPGSLNQEGDEESMTYQTTFANDLENSTLTVNIDESTSATATNDDDELSSTTVSNTEQVPLAFEESNDNFDVMITTERSPEMSRTVNTVDPTTTVAYSTNVGEFTTTKEINLFEEAEADEPSLETTTLIGMTQPEEYSTIGTQEETFGTTEAADRYKESTESSFEDGPTNFSVTNSSTDPWSSTTNSGDEYANTEPTDLDESPKLFVQDDAPLISNESVSTEATTASDDVTTINPIYFVSTDDEFLPWNDNITTEVSLEDNNETTTQVIYELLNAGTTENINDVGNISFVDVLLTKELMGAIYAGNISDSATSSSSDIANYFDTTPAENVTDDPKELDEIDQAIADFTPAFSIESSSEPTLSVNDSSTESVIFSSTSKTSDMIEIDQNENDNDTSPIETNFSILSNETHKEEDQAKYTSTSSSINDTANDQNTVTEEATTVVTNANDIGRLVLLENEPLTTTQTSTTIADKESVINSENQNSDLSKSPLFSYCINNTSPDVVLISSKTDAKSNSSKNEMSLKQNENIAERPSKTTTTMTRTKNGKTISKHVALPIMSAVLNITDKFERRLRNMFRNISTSHA